MKEFTQVKSHTSADFVKRDSLNQAAVVHTKENIKTTKNLQPNKYCLFVECGDYSLAGFKVYLNYKVVLAIPHS